MSNPLRVLDTRRMPARWNIAMTAALIELHRAGVIPDTLRFHRYPRSVLLGRHGSLRREVRVARCRDKKVEIARRVADRGTATMSPGILAWYMVIDRRNIGPRLGEATLFMGAVVAAGLARLGLPARFKSPGEIVIDGRICGGLTAEFEGSSLVMQGTIQIGSDLNEMPAVLKAASAAERYQRQIASLSEFLGRVVPIEEIEAVLIAQLSHALRRTVVPGILGDEETALAERLFADEIGTEAFVIGSVHEHGKIPPAREAHPL